MRRRGYILIVAAAALLLAAALAGCGPSPAPESTGVPTAVPTPPPGAGAAPLAGTAWVLTSLGGQPALDSTQVTLQFDSETLGGSAGCNSYGGGSNGDPYVATPDGELSLPQIASTAMACADAAVMTQEAAYLQALAAVAGYQLEGDTLELQNAAGETVLTYTRRRAEDEGAGRLAGTSWALTSLRGQPLVDDTQITIEFDVGTASGFSGCNSYGGGANNDAYVATPDGELALPQMARTAMLCTGPEGVMEQEDAYFEALDTVDGYLIEGDTLELHSGGEAVLTYTRRPESVGDAAALLGTHWRLVSMDGVAPRGGEEWTLAFHDDGLLASGFAGCRAYLAGYQAEGVDIRLGSVLAMMGPVCDGEALLEQEGTYTTMLGWVDRYVLAEGRLELQTVRGETLAFEPLPAELQPPIEGTEWTLLAFVEPGSEPEFPMPTEPLSGTAATATFDDGQVTGRAGCNTYGGSYALDGGELSVGELASTKMACLEPEGTMEQEARYLQWLGAATRADVYARHLWLGLDDGRALVFSSGPGQASGGPAPTPVAVGSIADARDALAAYDPVAGATAAVEALRTGIEGWLEAGGAPGDLPDQLAGDTPPIDVREAELTGQAPAEVVVHVAEMGLPLLVFVPGEGGSDWSGHALPADYAESVAQARPVDVDYPWEGGQQPAVRLTDLDGDGMDDVLLTYQLAGASSTTAWVSAYRWTEDDFGLVFHADVVSWAAPSALWLESDPAGGQLIRLTYPVFFPGRYPKVGVNPRGEQVWRWDGEAGRYVPGWQAIGPGRVFWPEAIAEADALMARGEYAAASDVYGAFIGDLDWQRAYLDDYGLEGCPLTSDEVGCRELNAWLDLAQLRQGLALALDGEPAAAQEILSWIELTPDLVALAQATIGGGGEEGGLFGALAAYERQIAAGPGPLKGEFDRPAAVYQAYQPSPWLVQRALNWLAPEDLPQALTDLVARVDAPVESLTVADLDGDGTDEVVWLSPPAWHALAPGETPVGNWQQAWVAWLDAGGRWEVTGIASADEIEMLDITKTDTEGRRAVVLRLVDGEDERQVRLVWDGEMHMVVAEQRDEWPTLGTAP